MRLPVTRHFFLLVVMLTFASPLYAQELPPEKGPVRTVKMFDIFCLSQLPELDHIAKFAGFGEFAEITGKELERYQPEVRADELRAWRFHDFGAEFILTAAKSKPDESFKKEVPKFAKSTSFACSLLIPATDPQAMVLKALVKLLGRDPDEISIQGPMRVHGWSGQNDKILSHVHYFAPVKGGPTSVLSARTFVKD